MDMDRVITEGHRGYCAKYPENTLVSFRAAMDLAVDFIEFDIWLSQDKVPVIMHDGNAYRTCGVDRKLCTMDYAEIKKLDAGGKFNPSFAGEKVPSLRELLELARVKRPDLRLGVEIKGYTEETVDLTVPMLREFGFLDTCFFYCFNARIIRYLKEKYAARTMGYPDFQMHEFAKGSYDFYDDIGISMAVLKSEVFGIFASKGKPMHMYCADNEEDIAESIRKGAAYITANDPVPLLRHLKRHP
jgi:glycerophosphoryl diester phosphodiesterase